MESEAMRKEMARRFVLIRKEIFRKTQAQMGSLIGISSDRLCDFEAGRKITDSAVIYRLFLCLMLKGIDIRLLFLEDFDMNKLARQKRKVKLNMQII